MTSFFALLLGLQLFQAYLSDTLDYLSRYLPAEGLAVFALITFAIVLVLVRLPRRESFIIGGMALMRLAVQFSDAPLRLIFATLGLILWMWFLAGSMQRLAVLPLAVFADTALRAPLWFDQLAFHREWWAILFCGIEVGLTFYFLYLEKQNPPAVDFARSEPQLSLLLSFVGLGAILFLVMLFLPNSARLVSSMPVLWAYIFIVVLMAVGVGLQFVKIPRHWIVTLVIGVVLVGSLQALTIGMTPGWLWFALSVICTWLLCGIIFSQNLPAEKTGTWRSGLVIFLSFLVLLVVFFLVEQESVHVMIPITGGMLAVAAGFASRQESATHMETGAGVSRAAGFILLMGLIGMGIWFASNQSPKVDGTPLTPVFVNGQEGYACYRIPSIVRAGDGSLLAFAEGRRDNCGDFGGVIRVVMKRSTDNGKTWSALTVVGENGNFSAASPSPVVDEQTGAVISIFNKTSVSEFDAAAGKGVRQVFITRSLDNGLSWSEAQEITSQVVRLDAGWRQVVPAVGHAIQLQSGRLFYTAHVSTNGNDVNHSQNYVFWSDDHGETWTIGGINPTFGYNESMAVELEDGSVMVNARAYNDGVPTGLRAVMIYPFDAGGNIRMMPGYLDPQLVTPTVASSIIRYGWAKDGKGVLLFSGPNHPRLRVNMSVRFSMDDGKTWSTAKTIDPGPAAYSDMVIQNDGLMGLLYERGNEGGIYYASFSLEWLAK